MQLALETSTTRGELVAIQDKAMKTETPISLAEAATVASGVAARTISQKTVWRWSHCGRGGKKLQTFEIAGRELTTKSILLSFIQDTKFLEAAK